MFDGLSSFVETLQREGELVCIPREVDPYLEIAEIADRTMKGGGPALLFERCKVSRGAARDSVSPFPLLINAFGSRRRMSLALGVADLDEHARAIADIVHTKAPRNGRDLAEMARRVPSLAHAVPRKIGRGACQDIILEGDAVNLDVLPVMTTWPKDGGPFFTLPNVITRDPDTGARNIGMYRMQLIDRRTTAMHWQIHKTGARHFRRAKELGKRLEVAVAFGGDPALSYAATAPLPDGIDEWMFAGFLRGRSVEYVRARTVDLDVPACADLVLEGYVDPSEPLFEEGPFGDHTGYYTPLDAFPRFHVTCVTHRKDAIYPSTVVGPPPMEDAWLGKATERLFLPLLKMMFPEVVDMNLPVEGAFHNLAIVSIKKQYPFHASRIAHGLWGAGQMSFTKVFCVVDDDVNVQDTAEVAWRLLANLDPKRDVSMVDGPVDQLDHGASQALWGGKMCIDGTKKWPEEGYKRPWPEVCKQSDLVRAHVDAIWSSLSIPLAARSTTTDREPARPEPVLARRAEAPAAHAVGNRAMFDRIAPTYDRMNRIMSLGIDRRWRARAVAMLESGQSGRSVLDLCAGTLDLASMIETALPDARIVACDASGNMLALGRSKVARVECVVGDALALPFDDGTFDAVICGFGVRNLADVRGALREVRRVLRHDGAFVTLELFRPRRVASQIVHGAGMRYALPALGAAIAKDRAAYAYLAESMDGFVTREAYEQLLTEAGFGSIHAVDLTLGIAAIVRAHAQKEDGAQRGRDPQSLSDQPPQPNGVTR
jgi:4-hydroxy-3-polyprenylbenzoate decarboxylase